MQMEMIHLFSSDHKHGSDHRRSSFRSIEKKADGRTDPKEQIEPKDVQALASR
jgi:hypothetical protein